MPPPRVAIVIANDVTTSFGVTGVPSDHFAFFCSVIVNVWPSGEALQSEARPG